MSEATEYFRQLDVWVQRWHKSCLAVKKRNLSEYDYMIGQSSFTQIEKNRILTNK